MGVSLSLEMQEGAGKGYEIRQGRERLSVDRVGMGSLAGLDEMGMQGSALAVGTRLLSVSSLFLGQFAAVS